MRVYRSKSTALLCVQGARYSTCGEEQWRAGGRAGGGGGGGGGADGGPCKARQFGVQSTVQDSLLHSPNK